MRRQHYGKVQKSLTIFQLTVFVRTKALSKLNQPFKDEAQTALFKDPVRTAQ